MVKIGDKVRVKMKNKFSDSWDGEYAVLEVTSFCGLSSIVVWNEKTREKGIIVENEYTVIEES